jgi:hypothetical protein
MPTRRSAIPITWWPSSRTMTRAERRARPQRCRVALRSWFPSTATIGTPSGASSRASTSACGGVPPRGQVAGQQQEVGVRRGSEEPRPEPDARWICGESSSQCRSPRAASRTTVAAERCATPKSGVRRQLTVYSRAEDQYPVNLDVDRGTWHGYPERKVCKMNTLRPTRRKRTSCPLTSGHTDR